MNREELIQNKEESEKNLGNKNEEKMNTSHKNIFEEDSHSAEEKLEELLKMGWTVLPESCNNPSCNCPLMRSTNGQKYCVGCEAWHFDSKDRPIKQKFGEIALKNQDTQLQVKDSAIDKKYRKKSFDYVLNQSVTRCLQTKLFYLATLLNNESDLSKIKEILSSMNICLENIQISQSLDNRESM